MDPVSENFRAAIWFPAPADGSRCIPLKIYDFLVSFLQICYDYTHRCRVRDWQHNTTRVRSGIARIALRDQERWGREMTIVESIKCILQQNREGLTARQIYDEIIRQNLYVFGAANPVGVVNGQLRRRCVGLDFPTAYPIKCFEIAGYEGKKIRFRLASEESVSQAAPSKPANQSESLPEEKINAALQEHIRNIRQQVLDCMLQHSPKFFEHLVLDLLLAMGYGADKSSGVVTGRSHDGGIDGIISEDKLGLSLIYIQAKKNAPSNRVGRKEIQAFIGAMEHVQKGVFITTSDFTKEAVSFAEKQQQKSIKLINGSWLADLLVRYRVGVDVAKTISLYKLDTNYYSE